MQRLWKLCKVAESVRQVTGLACILSSREKAIFQSSSTNLPLAKILHAAGDLERPGEEVLGASGLEVPVLVVAAVVGSPVRLGAVAVDALGIWQTRDVLGVGAVDDGFGAGRTVTRGGAKTTGK
jgi:hypothetical protein